MTPIISFSLSFLRFTILSVCSETTDDDESDLCDDDLAERNEDEELDEDEVGEEGEKPFDMESGESTLLDRLTTEELSTYSIALGGDSLSRWL